MPVRERTRKINLSDEEPVRVSRRRSARVTLFGGVAKASDKEDSPLYAALKTYESTQIADPFSQSYQVSSPLGVNSVIAPPFNPYALMRLPNENNTLRQCIDAMVINIEAMGHRFEYVGPEGGEESKEAQAELTRLEALTAQPNGEYGLLEFRERVRRDLETFGYRYIEICRGTFNRQIVSIYHVPAHSMRLTGMDNEETEVSIWLPRDGKMVMQKIKRRFRRYVQEVGSHRTYFKEYGDPRPISSKTGQITPGAAAEDMATEIHFGTLYTPGNLYGLPRWINQLPAVLGSRESEMTNLSFFRDNAIPAMAIMVSGGHLTADSIDEIEEHINAVRGRQSSHRVMVLEAEGSEKAAGPDKSISAPKVEMKSMLHDRQNDALFQEYDKNNQTKVRSSFRIPPIFIGRSEDMTYACYDDKTEVLTNKGWQRYDQFKKGTKVAAYDQSTGEVKFEVPENGKPFIYDFKGELFRIKNGNNDMAVTPGHRMLFANYYRDNWRVETVEHMVQSRMAVKNTATFESKEPLISFEPPHELLKGGTLAPTQAKVAPVSADLFLQFLGLFVSEGCTIQDAQGCRTTEIVIGQLRGDKKAKGDVLEQITACMQEFEKAGYTVRYNYPQSPPTKPDMVYHTIRHKGFRNWLRKNTGTHAINKRLPNEVMHLPNGQMRVLFDALMAGDGTYDIRQGRTSMSYSTQSEVLAGQVQEIALRLGYTAKIIEGTRCLRVQMSEGRDRVRVLKTDITREPYTGKVWCFRVSTGLFVTRRNGYVAIQGNTAEASLTMAEAQVFGPERNKIDDLFNQVVLSDVEGRMPIYWKFRSNPPRVSNPKDVLDALKTLDALGALTPNVAIGIANEMFDLNIETVKEDWGDFPFEIVKMLAQKGQLKGLDSLIAASTDALDAQGDTAPADTQVDPATGEEIKGLVKQALNGLKGKNNNVRKVSKTRK